MEGGAARGLRELRVSFCGSLAGVRAVVRACVRPRELRVRVDGSEVDFVAAAALEREVGCRVKWS